MTIPYKSSSVRRESAKKYYHNHKEKCLALSRDWLMKHPEKKDEYRKRQKERFKLRYHTDPEFRARERRYGLEGQRRRNHLQQALRNGILLEHGKCDKCGFPDVRALVFHHHFGNQNTHGYYRQLKEIVEKKVSVSVLCANCHMILHNPKKLEA